MPEAVDAWLRLTLTPGLGPTRQRQLLKAFGPPECIMAAGPDAAVAVAGSVAAALYAKNGRRDEAIGTTLAWLEEDRQRYLISLGDPSYPEGLLHLPDPPTVLYVQGMLTAFAPPRIALVGSRNCTPSGAANARAFARNLCQRGWSVVSGLALGIDTAAHEGALAGGGATLAVVGTGLDRVYPARNRDLAYAIVRNGALISEFPLGTPAKSHHFPQRNRLIAALSRGVLVVEAAAESGSLITARLAGELGREVMAIPGSIHSPQSRGCHRLLRQGATLVETVDDILDALAPSPPPRGSPSTVTDSANPAHPLLDAAGYDPIDLDTLVDRSGLTADAVLAILSELELDGRITAVPGGRYQRLS